MLDLPNLPHDNLYKFVAFAGLALLIVSNVLYERSISELNDLAVIVQSKHEASQSRAEIDRLMYESISRRIESATEKNEIQGIRDQAFQVATASQERSDALMNDLKRYGARNADIDRQEYLSIAGTTVGAILMILGLYLWYVKIQRPQDMMLLQQSKMITKTPPRLKG